MEHRILPLGPIQTNAYVLLARDAGQALVIDAPEGTFDRASGLARDAGLTIAACLLTHGHWDHLQDGWKFNEAGIPVYGHPADRDWFENPAMQAAFAPPDIKLNPVSIDHWLEDGQRLTLAGEAIEVRLVPGHAPGNCCFWFPDRQVVYAGDALFAGSVGRADLPGGSFEQLRDAIRTQLYTLPDETVVYPGHGPETFIGREAVGNGLVLRA
ncbi:MAG: MBL fold metallo-hydrolase [Opitutales bacterium]